VLALVIVPGFIEIDRFNEAHDVPTFITRAAESLHSFVFFFQSLSPFLDKFFPLVRMICGNDLLGRKACWHVSP
jgi:hypothetical protein